MVLSPKNWSPVKTRKESFNFTRREVAPRKVKGGGYATEGVQVAHSGPFFWSHARVEMGRS